jgi:hypothetical protein
MEFDQSGKIIIGVVIVGAVLGIGFVVSGGLGGDTPEVGDDTPEVGGDSSAPEPKSSLNYTQLDNATAQTIEAAGTYTSQLNRTQTRQTSNGTSSIQTTEVRRVDLTAGQGLLTTNESVDTPQFSQNISISIYTGENGTYGRQLVNDVPSYRTSDGSDGAPIRSINTSSPELESLSTIAAFEWEPTNETEDITGVETLRYTSTNATDPILVAGVPRADIESVQAEVWLDGTDTVRKFSYSYSIQTDRLNKSAESTFVLSDIGSTTMSEPRWLSEAKSNTGENTSSGDVVTQTPESSTETAEPSTATASETP